MLFPTRPRKLWRKALLSLGTLAFAMSSFAQSGVATPPAPPPAATAPETARHGTAKATEASTTQEEAILKQFRLGEDANCRAQVPNENLRNLFFTQFRQQLLAKKAKGESITERDLVTNLHALATAQMQSNGASATLTASNGIKGWDFSRKLYAQSNDKVTSAAQWKSRWEDIEKLSEQKGPASVLDPEATYGLFKIPRRVALKELKTFQDLQTQAKTFDGAQKVVERCGTRFSFQESADVLAEKFHKSLSVCELKDNPACLPQWIMACPALSADLYPKIPREYFSRSVEHLEIDFRMKPKTAYCRDALLGIVKAEHPEIYTSFTGGAQTVRPLVVGYPTASGAPAKNRAASPSHSTAPKRSTSSTRAATPARAATATKTRTPSTERAAPAHAAAPKRSAATQRQAAETPKVNRGRFKLPNGSHNDRIRYISEFLQPETSKAPKGTVRRLLEEARNFHAGQKIVRSGNTYTAGLSHWCYATVKNILIAAGFTSKYFTQGQAKNATTDFIRAGWKRLDTKDPNQAPEGAVIIYEPATNKAGVRGHPAGHIEFKTTGGYYISNGYRKGSLANSGKYKVKAIMIQPEVM